MLLKERENYNTEGMGLKEKIKDNERLRNFVMWTISPKRRPRPRLWIKLFVNPFLHKKGKRSKIRRPSRMDLFPYKKFHLGQDATVESFCVINNGAGDVIIGDRVRVGIGSVIIGNKYGVYINSSNATRIRNNWIVGNTDYGVYNGLASIKVDAENNYWG